MKPKDASIELPDEFAAVIERDGKWFVASCPEVPGANGQGRTTDEARTSLAEAVTLIREDRRSPSGYIRSDSPEGS